MNRVLVLAVSLARRKGIVRRDAGCATRGAAGLATIYPSAAFGATSAAKLDDGIQDIGA